MVITTSSPALLLLITLFSSLLSPLPAASSFSSPDHTSLLSLRSFLSNLSWPSHSSCCSWHGITCNSHLHVVSLNLSNASLSGSIPASSLANLSHLTLLDLSHNPGIAGSFPDLLPPSLLRLDLSHCSLRGSLPSTIANASALQELYLNHNRLLSSLPVEIASLPGLRILDVSNNRLSGGLLVPPGSFPKLEFLSLSGNFIGGSLPASITNCTSLRTLAFDWNRLIGPIPSDLGNLSNLQVLRLQGNDFTGAIPSHIANAKQLQQIWLEDNSINGSIPEAIGQLLLLSTLSLANNKLHGPFPAGIVTCTSLSILSLSRNQFSGELPGSLGNFASLRVLLLNDNAFSGPIPSELGDLQLLQVLDLSNNRLKGSVPPELGKLIGMTQISSFQPSVNCSRARQQLIDSSDACQRGVRSERTLDANCSVHSNPARNGAEGSIAIELGPVIGDPFLDFSDSTLLDGDGPFSIRKFSGLRYLDLSSNRLSGPIPRNIAVVRIACVNLSNNVLFYNPPLDVRRPRHMLTENGSPKGLKPLEVGLITGAGAFGAVLLLFVLVILCRFTCRRWRYRRVVPPTARSSSLRKFRRGRSRVFDPSLKSISMSELAVGTENFNNSRVIGDGGFGLVFRATMRDGRQLAVKKLSTDGVQGQREFEAEMETLGTIDHQNLVKLLAYCKLDDERVLVYEFVENGSLDTWLHENEKRPQILDWKKRLRIAQGSARGLAYLHHDSDPHIIHRDIKSSNILLTADFEPKIADFGLARNLSPLKSHVTTGVAGTLGYMAPEYASTMSATLPADVYSFGMVMLELGSGVRPNVLVKVRNLRTVVSWARKMVEEAQEMELLEPLLRPKAPPGDVAAYFRIACNCVSNDPNRRPTMQQVFDSLCKIRSDTDVPELCV